MFLYYANAAAKKATDSERTHEPVLAMIPNSTFYRRFNVEHDLGKIKLDAWKGAKGSKTIDLLNTRTAAYLEDEAVKKSIKETARKLVNIRRQRAQTSLDRWERFCHAVRYRCPVQGCGYGDTYEQRTYLEAHLKARHPSECATDNLERSLDSGKHYPPLSQSESPLAQAPTNSVG